MLDKILKPMLDLSDGLRQQAATLGEDARDRANSIIEDWMAVLEKLEDCGLSVSSFALSVALSPGLDVELVGPAQEFTPDRIESLKPSYKRDTGVILVLNTINTTYQLYQRTNVELPEEVVVQIKVRLTPEVKVYLGIPRIE